MDVFNDFINLVFDLIESVLVSLLEIMFNSCKVIYEVIVNCVFVFFSVCDVVQICLEDILLFFSVFSDWVISCYEYLDFVKYVFFDGCCFWLVDGCSGFFIFVLLVIVLLF